MKILLINFSDSKGGAAVAAVRLVTALNEYGVYARLGVPHKETDSPYVFKLPQKKHSLPVKLFRKFVSFTKMLLNPVTKRISLPLRFSTANRILHTTNFHSDTDINWINNSDFDIVNLHWISSVVCNRDIARIKKPIVWTMHDSWPCCGAEHHPDVVEGDTRWKQGYYRHNKPATTKGIDLCRKVWEQKKKYLGSKKIMFVAPSRWEHDVLKSSALFGHCDCETVPNIMDHSVFYPKDRMAARTLLGVPSDKTVIGFGAAFDINNPKSMKGSYYLINALQKLKNPEKYFLVVFGPADESFTSRITIPFFASGYISNSFILSAIYSLCDVIINPSLIENLPTICIEAACCGVPVVAFNVGGTEDAVSDRKTGYLCKPYSTEELAEGIEWCTAHREELSKNSINKARTDFDREYCIKKYIKVFEKTKALTN